MNTLMAQLTVVERLDKLLVSSESSIQLTELTFIHSKVKGKVKCCDKIIILQTHVSRPATRSHGQVSRAVEVHTNSGST